MSFALSSVSGLRKSANTFTPRSTAGRELISSNQRLALGKSAQSMPWFANERVHGRARYRQSYIHHRPDREFWQVGGQSHHKDVLPHWYSDQRHSQSWSVRKYGNDVPDRALVPRPPFVT